jgi:tetratricopeptide (TPR) repeat protein
LRLIIIKGAGNLLCFSGRITEAHYDFKPETAEEYLFRGVARFYRGELSTSIEDYNEALKLYPKSDYALKCKAFSLMHQCNYLLAIEELKKAIEIKPHGEYYDDIAENHSRMGMNREALEWHEKAIASSPNDPRLWYNCGTHLGKMNMVANAVMKFQKAIELYPEYDDAKYNLNHYYQILKNI